MTAPQLDDVFAGLEPGSPPARPAAPVVAAVEWRAPALARPPIPFSWAHEFKDEDCDVRQIVEGLLTEGGMSVWYGESNSGKTYMVSHLCYCCTRGVPFLGRRTERGAVIYIAGEGANSIRRRVQAFEKHHGNKWGAFGLIPSALNLMDPSADVEDLIALVREKASEIGEAVLLVVVDTVARAMGGANENASEDMARLVSAGDRIREDTGAHVLFIHHSGKDTAKGARGHSSLRAAVDTEVEVTADEITKIHTAQITKQRDLASKGERISGRFVGVEVGLDQWGGSVTACAVEDVGADEIAAYRPKVTGAAAQAVLGYLAGQDAGVRRPAIVEALTSQGVSRPSVYRAINELLQLGIATDTMGLIYKPKD